jgi:hypothetical protein
MGIVFLEGGGLYFLFCIMETEAQAVRIRPEAHCSRVLPSPGYIGYRQGLTKKITKALAPKAKYPLGERERERERRDRETERQRDKQRQRQRTFRRFRSVNIQTGSAALIFLYPELLWMPPSLSFRLLAGNFTITRRT